MTHLHGPIMSNRYLYSLCCDWRVLSSGQFADSLVQMAGLLVIPSERGYRLWYTCPLSLPYSSRDHSVGLVILSLSQQWQASKSRCSTRFIRNSPCKGGHSVWPPVGLCSLCLCFWVSRCRVGCIHNRDSSTNTIQKLQSKRSVSQKLSTSLTKIKSSDEMRSDATCGDQIRSIDIRLDDVRIRIHSCHQSNANWSGPCAPPPGLNYRSLAVELARFDNQ